MFSHLADMVEPCRLRTVVWDKSAIQLTNGAYLVASKSQFHFIQVINIKKNYMYRQCIEKFSLVFYSQSTLEDKAYIATQGKVCLYHYGCFYLIPPKLKAKKVKNKNKNRMICVLGPMTSTIGDFWRMVWQTCCGKIVMLTNLKEKNKVSSSVGRSFL